MIDMLAFSVFDEKAAVFSPPVFLSNKGLALRSFADVAADGKSPMAKHPEDFKLYHIGSFDAVSGKLEAVVPPLFLATAADFLQGACNA